MDSIALFFDWEGENSRQMRQEVRNVAPHIMQMSDEMFHKNFKLNKPAFNYVLAILEAHLPPIVRTTSLTAKLKLQVLLRFLAEGGYQHGTGQDFNSGIAQSTVSLVLSEVLGILEEHLCPRWISLKMTEAEKNDARTYFYQKCSIPGIVMCVDGTHIKIAKPAGESPHLFYNRKGFFSLNAMIICDHKQRIRFIDAKYPGSAHDSFIWGNSDALLHFKSMYNNGDRITRLLGDGGYPLSSWLITPFRSAGVNTPQSRFNKNHSSGRNIVERTIGVWKNWSRSLLEARQLHYFPKKAVQIINVSAALHNVRIHYNVTEEDLYLHDDSSQEISDNGPELIESARYAAEAIRIRNNILQSFI